MRGDKIEQTIQPCLFLIGRRSSKRLVCKNRASTLYAVSIGTRNYIFLADFCHRRCRGCQLLPAIVGAKIEHQGGCRKQADNEDVLTMTTASSPFARSLQAYQHFLTLMVPSAFSRHDRSFNRNDPPIFSVLDKRCNLRHGSNQDRKATAWKAGSSRGGRLRWR